MECDDEQDGASEDPGLAEVAAAIGEPARARMLSCLMDGRARTSTELAAVADVAASTASAHLGRLTAAGLVKARAQGRHRYYSLAGAEVAAAIEALEVIAGGRAPPTRAPSRLRAARSCYDHLAGALGVAVHDRMLGQGWVAETSGPGDGAYALTTLGEARLAALGVDLAAARARRRRFACSCLDWSERRPHLGGALGADLLRLFLDRRWLERDLDSRALTLTEAGRRQLTRAFGADPIFAAHRELAVPA